MDKIKILAEGIKPNFGGRETYMTTQYKCIDKNLFQYDFVFTSYKPFPERFKKEIEDGGGGEYFT